MPCEKCENGKYKWGKTGSCTYDTVAECEAANKDYYEDIKETKIVELVIADDSQELAIDRYKSSNKSCNRTRLCIFR